MRIEYVRQDRFFDHISGSIKNTKLVYRAGKNGEYIQQGDRDHDLRISTDMDESASIGLAILRDHEDEEIYCFPLGIQIELDGLIELFSQETVDYYGMVRIKTVPTTKHEREQLRTQSML